MYTYLCPWIIFPDNCISCMACSRHFTSSVGHRTRVAKAEAKEPAAAFCRSLQERNCRGYLGTDLQCSGATAPAISFLNLYSKYCQEKTNGQSWGKQSQGKRTVTWTGEMKKLSSSHLHIQLKYILLTPEKIHCNLYPSCYTLVIAAE